MAEHVWWATAVSQTGSLVLVGAGQDDTEADVDYLVGKIPFLRVFTDEAGKMNRSVVDVNGAILVVSQFTLLGNLTHGRRPSFEDAASPEIAKPLYDLMIEKMRARGIPVQTGVFGASMLVTLENDGPVTFVLDSPTR